MQTALNFASRHGDVNPDHRHGSGTHMSPVTLHRVTFTGADDNTDPSALATIAAAHPWVEFAVLVSPSQQGTGRYPSRSWRDRFYASAVPTGQRALHLCGKAVEQFAAGSDGICREVDQVSRVQLNFLLDRFNPYTLQALRDEILEWQAFAPEIEFILQANKTNAQLPARFWPAEKYSNVSFLVDSSGGRGIAPQTWPTPIDGFPTAYAGGIGPGRIRATLEALAQVTQATSIDMETSLRTDDRFDLAKVEAVVDELLSQCDVAPGPFGRPVLTFTRAD
jgi:hypothetical protein